MKVIKLLCAGIALTNTLAMPAQTIIPDSSQLQEVIITAPKLPSSQLQTPLAITLLEDTWIRKGQQQLTLHEALSAVPGLYISNADNFTQDLRIAVRGFGARAAFGIRGVRLLVDGLPETTADGQGQVDNIDPGALQRIEVLRGPAAALYGNAAGGVLLMSTDSISGPATLRFRINQGQFGMQQYRLATSASPGSWGYAIQASHQQLNGFREHSSVTTQVLNAKLAYRKKIQLIFNFVNSPTAKDPGALTLQEAAQNPRAARLPNLQFNAGENLTQGKMGITGHHPISSKTNVEYYGFGLFRNFNNQLPIQSSGWVTFFRTFAGAGTALSYKSKKSNFRFHSDFEKQTDNRKRYNNDNGQKGTRRVDQLEQFTNLAVGAQWQWNPTYKWQIQTALRSDRITQAVKDYFLEDGSDSGELTYFIVNPMVGASLRLRQTTYWYLNYATAFETPSLTELANPNGAGGFNPQLQPQRTSSIESGLKGRWYKWQYDVAVFHMSAINEIVPFEIDSLPNRTFYQNAGSTRRKGLELGLIAPLWGPLSARITWNFGHFVYKKAAKESNNGSFLPGLPTHHGLIAIQYLPENAFFAVLQGQYTSRLFAEDANSISIAPVLLVTGRTGYQWHLKKSAFQVFLGGNNLTNTTYFSNIRINAAFGRFYEPGPSTQLFGGIELRF
jgi:iron complex outermembrane receptor protein